VPGEPRIVFGIRRTCGADILSNPIRFQRGKSGTGDAELQQSKSFRTAVRFSGKDHDTDDQVFTKGSIRKGIVITTAHPGETSTALIVFAGGPVSSKSVGNNWYGDTLILQFPKGVLAVGANVFGNTSSGTSFSGKISAHFFSGTKALGGMAFTESAGGYVFIGASSSAVPITSMRIQWASDEDATAYASDIIFGP
jgi:hypothetical protein